MTTKCTLAVATKSEEIVSRKSFKISCTPGVESYPQNGILVPIVWWSCCWDPILSYWGSRGTVIGRSFSAKPRISVHPAAQAALRHQSNLSAWSFGANLPKGQKAHSAFLEGRQDYTLLQCPTDAYDTPSNVQIYAIYPRTRAFRTKSMASQQIKNASINNGT